MKTEKYHQDLKYTHPATKHEIHYRKTINTYEYLIYEQISWHADLSPLWKKSGMKRGFVLIPPVEISC